MLASVPGALGFEKLPFACSWGLLNELASPKLPGVEFGSCPWRMFHLSSSNSRRISALVCRKLRVDVGSMRHSKFIFLQRLHGSCGVLCCSTSQRIWVGVNAHARDMPGGQVTFCWRHSTQAFRLGCVVMLSGLGPTYTKPTRVAGQVGTRIGGRRDETTIACGHEAWGEERGRENSLSLFYAIIRSWTGGARIAGRGARGRTEGTRGAGFPRGFNSRDLCFSRGRCWALREKFAVLALLIGLFVSGSW